MAICNLSDFVILSRLTQALTTLRVTGSIWRRQSRWEERRAIPWTLMLARMVPAKRGCFTNWPCHVMASTLSTPLFESHGGRRTTIISAVCWSHLRMGPKRQGGHKRQQQLPISMNKYMSYKINHYLIISTIGCGQTFRIFWPDATCYTWAARGDEGFPINVRKVFALGTWDRILAIVLVHHKSLSVSYKYLFFGHLVCSAC